MDDQYASSSCAVHSTENGRTVGIAACLFITGLLLSASAGAAQIKLGLLGDSIVDDYLGPSVFNGVNTNLAAGSFGQIMAVTRPQDFDFGGYRAPSNNPTEAWDGIRNFGYEFNAATAGAAARDDAVVKLDFGPPPGGMGFASIPVASRLSLQVDIMVPLIEQQRVDTVIISVGGNDFTYHTKIFPAFEGGELREDPNAPVDQAFTDNVANSILSAVDRLNEAGDVDIIMAAVPKIPIQNPDEMAGVDAVNALLAAAAPTKGFVFFDSQEWSRTGPKVDPETGNIVIAGVQVPFASVASRDDIGPEGDGLFCNFEGDCPLDSHANFFISEDGIHLNTLMQGQLANEYINILNDEFGRDVEPIGDVELLQLVGVTPVPVPAGVWLLGSALAALGWFRRRVSLRSCRRTNTLVLAA
jgi:lysophospholipase L1-like esterase